jgi:MoxR-like ATPase
VQHGQVESFVETREVYERLRGSVRRVVLGKDRVVDLCLISLLAGGHILLTDLPGWARDPRHAHRLLCRGGLLTHPVHPDLWPSDITGTSVYDLSEARFKWVAGPVFAPVLLKDEIDRATPQTRNVLLKAMAEGPVTVEG